MGLTAQAPVLICEDMRRLLAVLLLSLALPLAAAAGERPEGLAFNRSGLPATLPLLIASDPGRDLYIELRDAAGAVVLAAHARGGAPARVLVPPGEWRLRLSLGTGWEGEARLFGAETERIDLPAPLRFAAGTARLSGHLVDLRGGALRVVERGLCQRMARIPAPLRRYPPRDWAEGIARDPFDPRAAEELRFGDLPRLLPRGERLRPWDREALAEAPPRIVPDPRQRRMPVPQGRLTAWPCD